MIPSSVRSADLVGKYVVTDRVIMNGAGIVIPKGTKVKVSYVARGFAIETDKCPCCGMYTIVRGITRKDVNLCEEAD